MNFSLDQSWGIESVSQNFKEDDGKTRMGSWHKRRDLPIWEKQIANDQKNTGQSCLSQGLQICLSSQLISICVNLNIQRFSTNFPSIRELQVANNNCNYLQTDLYNSLHD